MVGLMKGFWVEVCYSYNFIRRCPSIAFGVKTLFEVWLGNSANFDFRYGCLTCTHMIDGKLE